jgi:hypothetical protein
LIEETPEVVAPEPTPVLAKEEVVDSPVLSNPIFESKPEPTKIETAPIVEEVVASAPKPAPVEVPKSKNLAPAPSKFDARKKVVSMSKLVFNSTIKNSASVAVVQERLIELGFYDAGSDKRGWLSVGTMKSLTEFAKAKEVNLKDEKLFKRLFEGTSVDIVA